MKRLLTTASLSLALIRINFIKTGDPNADGLPYWSTYRQGEATVMQMHNGLHLIPAPNQPQMDCLEQYFKTLRQ